MSTNAKYSKQDCIESLQEAAKQLGHSPTITEYRNLNIFPSASVIYRKFDSWNEAKRMADLDTCGEKYGNRYSKEDCIEALQKASEELGYSPKIREYKELDILPDPSSICQKFGSWNEAKKAAGLETFGAHHKLLPIPRGIEISEDEWREFSYDKRFRIHKRARLDKLKVNVGCQRCGYDEHGSALQFHHREPKNKKYSISRDYTLGNVGWEKVKKEIKKCDILCANCHSIVEMDSKIEYKF